jgi:hypothetical protein
MKAAKLRWDQLVVAFLEEERGEGWGSWKTWSVEQFRFAFTLMLAGPRRGRPKTKHKPKGFFSGNGKPGRKRRLDRELAGAIVALVEDWNARHAKPGGRVKVSAALDAEFSASAKRTGKSQHAARKDARAHAKRYTYYRKLVRESP